MAERLIAGGTRLAVADVSQAALQPFANRDVPTAAQGAELPGEVVMTMLPTGAHVREALLGPGGACTGRPRRLVVDMSTASPEGTVALGAELSERAIGLLDAPVSGGMAGVREGTLTAMVGGDPDLFASVRPLLARICAEATWVGPLGSGHIVKALNNFLSAVTLWSSSEALAVGTRLGLDPKAMLEVWTKGSGRSHASEVKLPRHVLTRSFDFGQTLELFCKDIAIAADLADRTGVATPALDLILENWRAARDQLGGGEDITRVAELLERSRR